jgi:tRNA nucleotidyltransferase/poly(A) polymerase
MDPSVKTNLESINQLSRQLGSSLYLVGGTVRDHLIGRPCTDYDFTSSKAPEIARAWAQKIRKTLVPLDETPGHETYRVVLHRNLYFDFTTLQGQTIEEDLSQRDFTINAMAVSLPDLVDQKENLIDPFGGQNDLHNQIIRAVPGRTFEDDPLRLLRAFRFASTLEFDIDPETIKQIKTHKSKLNEVAQERVTHEILLLLGATRSRIDLMDPTGLTEVLFPGIAQLKTKPGSQPNGTLWEDTLHVFREMENILTHPDQLLEKHTQQIKDFLPVNHHYALLKCAALIRLLITAPDPPFEVADFLREFRLSNSDVEFVDRTLKFAEIMLLEAGSTAGGFKEDSSVYQFIHQSGNELISSLLLSFAVRLGNQEDIKYFIPLINRILEFYIKRYIPAQDGTVLLDGEVLKKKFQLKPSPRFKSILEKVEEARVLGTIETKEEAEQLAKALITSQVELAE